MVVHVDCGLIKWYLFRYILYQITFGHVSHLKSANDAHQIETLNWNMSSLCYQMFDDPLLSFGHVIHIYIFHLNLSNRNVWQKEVKCYSHTQYPFPFARSSCHWLADCLFSNSIYMFYGNIVRWPIDFVCEWQRFDVGYRENGGDKKMLCIHFSIEKKGSAAHDHHHCNRQCIFIEWMSHTYTTYPSQCQPCSTMTAAQTKAPEQHRKKVCNVLRK